MSIHRVAYVICDGCGCNDSADMADEGATATMQRKELKTEMGWNVFMSCGDLCPECYKAHIAQVVRESRAAQGFAP